MPPPVGVARGAAQVFDLSEADTADGFSRRGLRGPAAENRFYSL
jgi:hypothetical protein